MNEIPKLVKKLIGELPAEKQSKYLQELEDKLPVTEQAFNGQRIDHILKIINTFVLKLDTFRRNQMQLMDDRQHDFDGLSKDIKQGSKYIKDVESITLAAEKTTNLLKEQFSQYVSTTSKQADIILVLSEKTNLMHEVIKKNTELADMNSDELKRLGNLVSEFGSQLTLLKLSIPNEVEIKAGTGIIIDKKIGKKKTTFTVSQITDTVKGKVFLMNSPGGSSQVSSGGGDSFETVAKNLKAYSYTINYSGDDITSIVYNLGTGIITKTLNLTGDNLTSIVLSDNTPAGISLTKTLVYTGDNITSVNYS